MMPSNEKCGSQVKFCIQIPKCLVLTLSRSGTCTNLSSLALLMGKKMCFTQWLYCLESQEHVAYIFFARASKIQLMRSMASFCFTFRITPFSVVFSSYLHVQMCWTEECFYEYLKGTNSVCVCMCAEYCLSKQGNESLKRSVTFPTITKT